MHLTSMYNSVFSADISIRYILLSLDICEAYLEDRVASTAFCNGYTDVKIKGGKNLISGSKYIYKNFKKTHCQSANFYSLNWKEFVSDSSIYFSLIFYNALKTVLLLD